MEFDATKQSLRSRRVLRQLPRVIGKGAALLIAFILCSDTSFSQEKRSRDFAVTQGFAKGNVGLPGFNLISWGPYYDEQGDCGYGSGMFLFSSDRIRFVMPLDGRDTNPSLAGATAALTDDGRRFSFEIKSDNCAYRTTIQKSIRKNGGDQLVLFDSKSQLEVNTPEFRIWMGTFTESDDSCFSAIGDFYYSNDKMRFVMPIHVMPDLVEDGGPNKNAAGGAEGFTDGDRGLIMELKSPNCKYYVTIEKFVKIEGKLQVVPVRRSMDSIKPPP